MYGTLLEILTQESFPASIARNVMACRVGRLVHAKLSHVLSVVDAFPRCIAWYRQVPPSPQTFCHFDHNSRPAFLQFCTVFVLSGQVCRDHPVWCQSRSRLSRHAP